MHVLCVTPNVSIDRTLVVPGFSAGGVWRAAEVSAVCGGKGVNVARGCRVGPPRHLCRHAGRTHWASCRGICRGRRTARGVDVDRGRNPDVCHHRRLRGRSQCDQRGGVHHLNGALGALRLRRRHSGRQSVDAVCISGSVPPGAPEGALRELIERAAGRNGCPVWVDASGAALAEAMTATPIGIKVNAQEAAALVGQPVVSAEGAAIAAEAIRRRGTPRVAITLGAAGAVLASDGASLWARSPAIAAVNAVGSGDCFLAGLVAGWHERGSPEEALRLATAAGAANALRTTVGVSAADVAGLLAKTTLTLLH